jgi:AcrR family transcriptional regulator
MAKLLDSSRAAGLQVAEIQRSRLIAAAIRAVGEVGYTATTVAQITGRARVSRRTFYELFPNQEACLAAAVEYVLEVLEGELATLQLDLLPWRERIRAGLAAILAFLDREPVLARLCVVQSMRGGPAVLARREQALARLAAIIDGGRLESARVQSCTELTAEGVVGAALAIVQSRLAGAEAKPLSPLLGELMSMIVLPYLGASAARRELTRPERRSPAAAASPSAAPTAHMSDPLEGVPMRLTYRTMKVLESVAENPGASNREVAERAGIHDQGQVSKLLARLERLGLLSNRHDGHLKGEPNAWTLARTGELVVQSLHTNNTCRPGAIQRSGAIQRRGSIASGRTAAMKTGRGSSGLDLQVNGTGESH